MTSETPEPASHTDLSDHQRGRVRSRGWRRVARGLHVRVDVTDPERSELRAWQSLLPATACFTGFTAARLRGWDLPPMPRGTPVCVSAQEDDHHPIHRGLLVTRHREPPPYDDLDGLRVATPGEIVVWCARWLGVLDLVVLVDAALREGVDPEALASAAARRRRGAPRLREALAMADARAESVWESLLRVLHVVGGVEVEPQRAVHLDGVVVARADLWIVGTRTIQEYDGAHHLDAARFRLDRRRDRRLVEAGVVRNAYTAPDVTRQAAGILRDACRALGREPDPARLREWSTLFRESSFSPAGRASIGEALRAASAGRPSRPRRPRDDAAGADDAA